MESIIKDVMTNYLTVNNIILPSQHAFQKGHFTGFQLLECLNDWTAAVESGLCIDVCCLDFARVYHTVSIQKLLYKLNSYGYRGLLLSWLGVFLESRTFCVRVNGENSINNIQIRPIVELHRVLQLAHCVSSYT